MAQTDQSTAYNPPARTPATMNYDRVEQLLNIANLSNQWPNLSNITGMARDELEAINKDAGDLLAKKRAEKMKADADKQAQEDAKAKAALNKAVADQAAADKAEPTRPPSPPFVPAPTPASPPSPPTTTAEPPRRSLNQPNGNKNG